jgi:WD40 repeat protein
MPLVVIQVSEKDALMVTGETTIPNGQLILWDLREGKRLATLRPHADLLQCAAFSTDGAMLVTVGTDAQHRQQIVVWDVAALITEKSASIHTKTTALVAKQISEFPVLKIRFSPFEEFGLVSCGRENIRFWRIRKGHLPGRPVLLNEYARCVSRVVSWWILSDILDVWSCACCTVWLASALRLQPCAAAV